MDDKLTHFLLFPKLNVVPGCLSFFKNIHELHCQCMNSHVASLDWL